MVSNLTTLISNFITGVAAVPAIVLIFYFSLAAHPSLNDLQEAIDYVNAREHLEWMFVGVGVSVCVLTGVLLDFIGFGLIEETIFPHFWDRKNMLAKSNVGDAALEKIIDTLSPNDRIPLDVNLQSYFYSQAPPHMLAYHAQEWTYLTTCRNLTVAAFLYLVAGAIYFTRQGAWAQLAAWVVGGLLVVLLLFYLMYQGVRYYHRIEAVFVIGWLRAKQGLKDASEVTLKTVAAAPNESSGGGALEHATEAKADDDVTTRGAAATPGAGGEGLLGFLVWAAVLLALVRRRRRGATPAGGGATPGAGQDGEQE